MEKFKQAQNVRMVCSTWADPKSGLVMPLFEIMEETADEWNKFAFALFLRNYIAQHGSAPVDIGSAYAAHLAEGERVRRDMLAVLAASRKSGEVVL